MGEFNISITAVGGHGCDRKAKEGERLSGCGRMSCPDCEAKRFFEEAIRRGFGSATMRITHWPGTTTEVVDEYSVAPDGLYVIGTRVKGQFSPPSTG